MKRALIVSPDLIVPVNTGSRMRTWKFVEALRDEYEISLAHPCFELPDAALVREAKRDFANVWSIPVQHRPEPTPKTPAQRVQQAVRLLPWDIERSYRPELSAALNSIVAHNNFDVIIVRYIYQAQYFFDLAGRVPARIIVDLDDIEPIKAERLQAVTPDDSAYLRMRLKLDNWMWRRYHRVNLPRLDACLLCSEQDRDYVASHGWSSRAAVVPNAIDLARFQTRDRNPASRDLLFCGTLSYKPNRDAIVWFASAIWPHILRQVPDARFVIVGRTPPAEVQQLAASPSIEVHGDVPDVLPFYERAAVVVVPLRAGGGTRIKILEAGASRRPVVSTTIGAEGLDLVSGTHCLIADDPGEFAAHCSDLLRDDPLARRIVCAHRQFVEERYDGSVVTRHIREIVDGTSCHRRATAVEAA
jgi:glycosyltransferase involved in cell wall biosynthesis